MSSLTIRPFALEDGPAVGALSEWAWWPRRSQAGWAWLMDGPNGAARQAPTGWVAERDGEIVASVSNHAQTFVHDGQTFMGATGHSLLVRPEVRGASRPLLKRFSSQQGAFALFTFNANALSAGHYRHYGMYPWPRAQAQTKYAWRVDPVGVLTERLYWRYSRMRDFAGARDGERFVPARLWETPRLKLEPDVTAVSRAGVDHRFDALWERLKTEGRLMAVRDRAALAWRFADPDLTRAPVMLAFHADGELAGYILAFFSKQTEIERPTLEIVDLIAVSEHEARAIPALIRSLIRSARDLGAARVRLSLVNPRLEPLIAATAGARKLVSHTHAHVRFGSDEDWHRADAWYATPYDGDYSYVMRPPPRPSDAKSPAEAPRRAGSHAGHGMEIA